LQGTISTYRDFVNVVLCAVVAEFEKDKNRGCEKAGSREVEESKGRGKCDANNLLDIVVSPLYSRFMARFPDIIDGLEKQIAADATEIHKTGAELQKLRSAYQRYRELTDNLDSRIERVRIVLGLLAEQEKWNVGEAVPFLEELKIEIEAPEDIRAEISLWKMIREVVRQVEELRIVELENVMRELKVKASRQALEAAIDAHKRTFQVRRSGREKFVSLKGA
jgi:hypothetical protein